jgi:tRNA nucleotidyltransferase (CCA-adding enzyme)
MNLNSIFDTALKANKIENITIVKKEIKNVMKEIDTALKKNKIKAELALGGSASKDTLMGKNFDVDIFVMFDYKKYKQEDISSLLKDAIKHLKPETIHGSRDYYLIDKRYEIIPVLKIKSYKEVINITDASPLHASWVKKKIKLNPKLKDEIKLAKIFFKACGVYGAESYIKGISGHVSDILVIYYGSFMNLIKAISKWNKNIEIDVEKHKTVLDKSKIQGPIIVIDPIQPNRNAAAAVDYKTYNILKKKAKEFLKKPNISFFIKKDITISELKDKYNLILKINVPIGKTDIIGAKLMKGYEHILKELKEFTIIKSDWYWDKENTCFYYFKTKEINLSQYYIACGPSNEYPEHIIKFKQKYKKTFIQDKKICAKVKREITTLKDKVLNISKDKYLKEKIRGIEIVK